MQNKITSFIKKLELRKGDHIIIHGNLGFIAQIDQKKNIKILIKLFFKEIKKRIGIKGVVLVPAFTYNFCKNRISTIKDISEVGQFSEMVRKIYNKRTTHPIFSFTVIGYHKAYKDSSRHECFGKDSIFEKFMKNKGKIICLVSGFDTITFVHHIEEIFKVKYRKYKIFNGLLKIHKKREKISVRYFVRRNKKIKNNFINFEKNLKKKKKIIYLNFLRFHALKVKAKDLFQEGMKSLKLNPNFLI